MGRKDELIDSTIEAFEESTGNPPNDYEYAEIKVAVDDYIEEIDDCN